MEYSHILIFLRCAYSAYHYLDCAIRLGLIAVLIIESYVKGLIVSYCFALIKLCSYCLLKLIILGKLLSLNIGYCRKGALGLLLYPDLAA